MNKGDHSTLRKASRSLTSIQKSRTRSIQVIHEYYDRSRLLHCDEILISSIIWMNFAYSGVYIYSSLSLFLINSKIASVKISCLESTIIDVWSPKIITHIHPLSTFSFEFVYVMLSSFASVFTHLVRHYLIEDLYGTCTIKGVIYFLPFFFQCLNFFSIRSHIFRELFLKTNYLLVNIFKDCIPVHCDCKLFICKVF